MDIRVKKTKTAITNAFIELAKQKPIERITVKEIVSLAQINKSTFYAHYTDIYDLIDSLLEEATQSVVDHMDSISVMFDDPRTFFLHLYHSLEICKSNVIQPFSASDRHFAQQLTDAIYAKASKHDIVPEEYQIVGALLTFTLNGIIGLHKMPSSPLTEESLQTLADFFESGVSAIMQTKKRV